VYDIKMDLTKTGCGTDVFLARGCSPVVTMVTTVMKLHMSKGGEFSRLVY
jgi:hypothetical protein